MKYKISPKRAEILDNNFFEFSFNDKTPDKKLFDSITEPAELHYIADKYNWDDGPEVLAWIINNPICDIGTAKLIFWRAQPDDYTSYSSEEESSDGVYTLLQNIITNFEKGFYKNEKILYDPLGDDGAPDINNENPNPKWKIPDYLKTRGKGKPISTGMPGVAEFVKARKPKDPIKFEIEGDEIHIPKIKLRFKVPSGFKKLGDTVFNEFLKNYTFRSDVNRKFRSSGEATRKAAFAPVFILNSADNYIVFYVYSRASMLGDEKNGEVNIGITRLLNYDLMLVIGAYLPESAKLDGGVGGFKIGNYRASLVQLSYEYATTDKKETKKKRLFILYVDTKKEYLAFYMVKNFNLDADNADLLINSVTFYEQPDA